MKIFRQLRWQDILDIILLSLLLYRLLLFIKGTRAVQMLIGIGVCCLPLSPLSGYTGLYTMDWIIQSFWGSDSYSAYSALSSLRSEGRLSYGRDAVFAGWVHFR